ncbi:MAG: hypothetical protein AAB562_01320 [Patescibacteria group bacterium]
MKHRAAIAIAALALTAFVLRFGIAVLFPQWTYASDMIVYQNWIEILRHVPVTDYYRTVSTQFIAPYPPLFLYVLKALGPFVGAVSRPDLVVKFPAMLADIGVGATIFFYGRHRWGSKKGFIAAAAFLFNPAVILVSAVWGQTDALYALPLLLAFLAASAGRPVAAAGLGVASALLKVQGAVFLPLLFTVIAIRDRKRLGRAALAAGAAAFIVLLPFLVSGRITDVLAVYTSHSVAKYPWVSVYAWNFWWPLAITSPTLYLPDTGTVFGVSFLSIGVLLFGAAYLAILAAVFFRRVSPLPAAAFLAFSFFMLPTEIHERYLFPTLVFLPMLFGMGRVFAVSFAALSATFAANLYFVLPFVSEPARLLARPETVPAWLLTNVGWIVNGVVFLALISHAVRTAHFCNGRVKSDHDV